MHSLDPGVSGYLVGPRKLACVWWILCVKSCGCQAVCSPGSGDGLWMNWVLWPGVIVHGQECSYTCVDTGLVPPPWPSGSHAAPSTGGYINGHWRWSGVQHSCCRPKEPAASVPSCHRQSSTVLSVPKHGRLTDEQLHTGEVLWILC